MCKACARYAWRDLHKLESSPQYRSGTRFDNDAWNGFLDEVKQAHRLARLAEKEKTKVEAKAKAKAKADYDSDMDI